jgi:hypothetical protein
MSSCDNSNIKKNYIVTGTEQDILSACTGFYTNNIYSCSGDTITIESDILSTNTINSSVILSGGTNLLDIFGGSVENTFITGFTYDNSNNLSIQRNDGVSFDVNISEFSGLTINGVLSACTGVYTSNLYGCSPITIHDDLLPLNDGGSDLGSPVKRFRDVNTISGTSTVWTSTNKIITPELNLGLDSSGNTRTITANNSIIQDDILNGGDY